jgi:hypothetical protein
MQEKGIKTNEIIETYAKSYMPTYFPKLAYVRNVITSLSLKVPIWIYKRYLRSKKSPVTKVFFVLSTGRSGSRYLSKVLDLSSDATVEHEPPPGAETVNGNAYEAFLKNPKSIESINVYNHSLLKEHSYYYKYKQVKTPVFGDCHNSIYPYAIAYYNFFKEIGISTQFIHLLREPIATCSSILRAEGVHGIGIRKNFGLRAKKLIVSKDPAVVSANIWIEINRVISYQINFIERLSPGATRVVRIEDLNGTKNLCFLFKFLSINVPDHHIIEKIMNNESDDVRHSHQKRLDRLQIPPVSNSQLATVKRLTNPHRSQYGYKLI